MRTASISIGAVTEGDRSYLVFRAEGSQESVWLRRDLLVHVDLALDGLWVGGLFRIHGRPNFVHLRCAPEDAENARAWLEEKLDLPVRFEPVGYDELVAHPQAFSGRFIDCRGPWTRGFESSSFAGAWVDAPADAELPRFGTLEVRVLGHFEHSLSRPAFGHLGMSRSLLEVFDTAPRLPGVRRSWLESRTARE